MKKTHPDTLSTWADAIIIVTLTIYQMCMTKGATESEEPTEIYYQIRQFPSYLSLIASLNQLIWLYSVQI